MMPSFRFEMATLVHKDLIFEWLDTPHVKEFWDNSEKHRQDILAFMKGRKDPSDYFGGMFSYWVGFVDQDPFCFILTHAETDSPDTPEPYRSFVSKTGTTYGLDFGIGSEDHIGKGFAAPAISAFVRYMVEEVDPKADTFFIDPFLNNPRALHVYEKAGFHKVAEFAQEGGHFDQTKGVLMVKTLAEGAFVVRSATKNDIESMVALSDNKRRLYEKAQPQFWRRAKSANEEQAKWLEYLLSQDSHILVIAEDKNKVVGFIVGELNEAPEVYDPGGLTLVVDDFCVEGPGFWRAVGGQLLKVIQEQAKQKGAVQVVVVCGHHDEPKRCFLKSQELAIASEWYVGRVK